MASDPTNVPGVTTTHGPTGPKTEAGKSRAAQNAVKHGLFTAHDFIRDGEEQEYAQTLTSLMNELAPKGDLEQTFATEIIGATWRLRRCRLVEEAFSLVDDLDFDPMLDERTEKKQRSIDRARAQSHCILRRSIAELSKLQTERQIRIQLFPGGVPGEGLGVMEFRKAVQLTAAPAAPANHKTEDIRALAKADFDAMMAAAESKVAQQYRDKGLFCKPAPGGLIATESAPQTQDRGQSFCKPAPGGLIATESAPPTQDRGQSFCKPSEPGGLIATKSTAQTQNAGQPSRNAACPCGSGQKFKRCCARTGAGWSEDDKSPAQTAPPALNKAA